MRRTWHRWYRLAGGSETSHLQRRGFSQSRTRVNEACALTMLAVSLADLGREPAMLLEALLRPIGAVAIL